jgi:hypothetical protein
MKGRRQDEGQESGARSQNSEGKSKERTKTRRQNGKQETG